MNADLVVLQRNKLLTFLAWALLIGGPLMIAALATGLFPPGVFGIHLTAFGVALMSGLRRFNTRPTKKRANVVVGHEGVRVDGELVVPRDKIESGFFQPRWSGKYGSALRLTGKRGEVLFEAETDEPKALELLHALGLDPGSRRAQFAGASPLYATIARQMAFTFGIMGVVFATSFLFTALQTTFGGVGFLVFLPLLFAGMYPSKITVGVDGILVRWLWTKKFIPMSEVRSVTRDGDRGITIDLASGTRETIYTGMRRRTRSQYQSEHRDAVLARINEALWHYRSRGPIADVSALVARGTRTRTEWLDALRKLAGAEGGYRDAVVRDEDLFRVVEDPAAPEDARAGAALLLKRSFAESEEARARVRVAAEATASPKLRVVLDAATSDKNDAALEEAIADLAPAEQQRRATSQ